MAFSRDDIKSSLADLAANGVLVGTSSWKYSGWRGMLYDEARYVWRGKFAESRFEKNCLAEYAEVFKTVCVDAAFYTFPQVKYLEGLLVSQNPSIARSMMGLLDFFVFKMSGWLWSCCAFKTKISPHFLHTLLN